MSCVLLVVALFCIECAVPAVLIALPYLLVFTARSRRLLSVYSRNYCYGQKNGAASSGRDGADVGGRKRGVVGACADFLDVNKSGGADTGEMLVL